MGLLSFFFSMRFNYCQFDSLYFVIINLIVVIFNFKSFFLNELMVKIKLLQIVDNINQIEINIERERERERVNVQETAWKDSHNPYVPYRPIKE